MTTRSKSVSPWNRVWEVLCPDCGEVRSAKWRPKRGIMVSRCMTCAFKERERKRGRGRFRSWHWATYGGAFNPQSPGNPCSLQRCVDCGTIGLVVSSNLPRGGHYRCLSCGISHSYQCSVTGDTRKTISAKNVGSVYGDNTCAISRCACCGEVRLYWGRRNATRMYCTQCYHRHQTICGERDRTISDLPEGYITVKEFAVRNGLSRSVAYRKAQKIGIKPGVRNGSTDALLVPA